MNRLLAALKVKVGCCKYIVLTIIAGLVVLPSAAWSSEATLQAAFVYNFIKFIDWPTTEADTALRLCVVGANKEMRVALGELDGKMANKKAIAIIYFNSEVSMSSIESCQMIYRSGRSIVTLPEFLPKGVVLVANGFAKDDTNASIVLQRNDEGRIEFSINQAAISHSGVTISSQLLKLAINTGGKG